MIKTQFHCVAAVACFAASIVGCGSASPSTDAAPESTTSVATGEVTVRINWPTPDPELAEAEFVEHVKDVADGTSLETVMRGLKGTQTTITGSGDTAFVTAIGDNPMSGDSGWTFMVDGEHANQGIGATVLHPPTTVTWSYGSYEAP